MQLDYNDLLVRLLVSVDRVLIRITPHARPHGVTPVGGWSVTKKPSGQMRRGNFLG